MKATKLWVDDLRPEPEGWIRAKTVAEAIQVLESETVELCSLDYHLGDEETTISLLHWMAQSKIWPKYKPSVHSNSAAGRLELITLLEQLYPTPS